MWDNSLFWHSLFCTTLSKGCLQKKKKKLSDICQNSNIPHPPYHIFDNFQFWQKTQKVTPSLPLSIWTNLCFSWTSILLILVGKNSQIYIRFNIFSIIKSQYQDCLTFISQLSYECTSRRHKTNPLRILLLEIPFIDTLFPKK